MDSTSFNINQYEYDCAYDCAYGDPLLSNKELPSLMDWLEEESCNFNTFQGDCLIGMQNPCFDLVDQDDPACNLIDVMPLQVEYPFEELDMTLWEDNFFSNNPSYGHTDQCSIRKSNDVLVSMSDHNPIEKENNVLIVSRKEDEHGWQGMKLPSKGMKSYDHMSGVDQYRIPNVLDQFLVNNNRFNGNEKINGDTIMSNKEEDVHGWHYGHMNSNLYSIPNSIVSSKGLNVNEQENGAMTNIIKNKDGHDWQGEARNTIMHPSLMNVERKQRSRSINFEEMSKYFYVPIMQAAREMNVGLTVLKKRCRELGIYRWPHRKMKSLDSLIHNVQEMKIRGEGEGCEIIEVESLIEHKRMMEKMPDMELTTETKKLRQACFKANFKKRRMAIGPY